MIVEQILQGELRTSVANENPALALAEANGYIASKRDNWVIKEVVAEMLDGGKVQFIGLVLK